jgi:hypothetical protein
MLAAVACACLLAAGCSSAPRAHTGTVESCYAFAVRALEHHVTVTTQPRACEDMTRAEVNLAVGRAIRDVVGPLHKAAARRADYRDGLYLEHLVKTVHQAPPSVTQAATSPTQPGGLPVSLAALAVWIVTAAAGSYLLFGWLAGITESSWRRRFGKLPITLMCHFSLALTGLALWIAFVASNVAALAWVDFGLILPVAGLGMATLFGWMPSFDTAQRGGTKIPVIAIVLHGTLATATILLVLTAAIAA